MIFNRKTVKLPEAIQLSSLWWHVHSWDETSNDWYRTMKVKMYQVAHPFKINLNHRYSPIKIDEYPAQFYPNNIFLPQSLDRNTMVGLYPPTDPNDQNMKWFSSSTWVTREHAAVVKGIYRCSIQYTVYIYIIICPYEYTQLYSLASGERCVLSQTDPVVALPAVPAMWRSGSLEFRGG